MNSLVYTHIYIIYIYIYEIIGLYAYIYETIGLYANIYIYKVILYGNTRCVYGRGRVFSTNHTYGP